MTPERTQTLLCRHSRRELDHLFTGIVHGVRMLRTEGSTHVDIITRARAHHLTAPEAVIDSWAAASYAGLSYWTDTAPVTLLVRSGFYKTTDLRRPNRRRLSASLEKCTPDPEFPNLRTTMLPYAAAQCLRDIVNNAHGWWTYNVPGLSYGETRSVQFIDAIRQLDPHLNLGDIQAEAKGVVKKTIVEKAVGLSDPGAQSPPETALRLIAAQVHPGLTTQIPIYYGGRLVTKLDCGWRKEKVGLFYDGEHHLTRKQHDYDAEVTLILHDLGWESMRVTNALLQNPTALQRHIAQRVIPRAL